MLIFCVSGGRFNYLSTSALSQQLPVLEFEAAVATRSQPFF